MKKSFVLALLFVVLALGIVIGFFIRSRGPELTIRQPVNAPEKVNAAPSTSVAPRRTAPSPHPQTPGVARLPAAAMANSQHAIPLMSGLDPAHELADARSFATLDADQAKELDRELAAFRATADVDQRVEILDRIESLYYGEAILPLLVELARPAQPPELRSKAVELVAGNMSPSILTVLDTVLTDPDPLLQSRAVLAANHVQGPALLDFLRRVFAHPNANTRLAGLECLDEQPIEVRVAALKLALGSNSEPLQVVAVEKLMSQSNHQSVEALIPMLDSASERVRSETSAALHFLFGEEFADAPTATEWWQKNRARFDKDLNEK